MTAEQVPAGAASDDLLDWHAIDWQSAQESVRRLQARIVKATKEGRWGRVKALQHLLTHSFYGKALAVRRVTENQGKNTPGVDQITWNNPKSKMLGVRSLKRRGYQPLPLRRVYIPKSNGKMRPLGIPTMKDRAMQALHLLALDPVAETVADPHSYGFRVSRSTADAQQQCFTVLGKSTSAQWVLEGDIKSCFDKINHDWLLANVPTDKVILRKWLKAGYLEAKTLFETDEGTPQGGVISPVLANIALDGLQNILLERFPHKTRWATPKDKVNLVRYADDFIITGTSKELLEDEVMPLVTEFMRERGLELSKDKTRVTHIEEGFDFLGWNIRKYNGGKTLLIKPSKKNVKTFMDNIRKHLNANKQAETGNLIVGMNRKLRGWTNYHRSAVSKRTFSKVDNDIHKALWHWATRRHPRKRKWWISRHYFEDGGSGHWTFHGFLKGKDGKKGKITLFEAAKTPIVRHRKVVSEANPYDPEWETYFEERLGLKMASSLQGRKRLHNLWKEQNGVCPVCNQKITNITKWHSHHLVWKVFGGSDNSYNRVLLHPDCHRKVHAKGLTVKKPRPSEGVMKA